MVICDDLVADCLRGYAERVNESAVRPEMALLDEMKIDKVDWLVVLLRDR